MGWTPIAASGAPFSFVPDFGSPQMAGSVVSAAFESGPAWSITFTDNVARNVRVTVQAYDSQQVVAEDPSYFEFDSGEGDPVQVFNQNTGNTGQFTPSPVSGLADTSVRYRAGHGSETVRDESYSMLVEVEAADTCKELGRSTRAYASAYTLDRVQVVRAIRTQQRCLIADFNGAVPKGRAIVSTTWRCTAPWITILSDAAIAQNGRAAQVTAKLSNCGFGHVKCSVTLDNGETYIQMFEVRVVDAPWFYENFDQPGPYELTATA